MKKQLITLLFLALYAITAHAQKSGDYRSIKSGNWTDYANVWQKYNGSSWTAATTYPTSSDGVISILDTTVVTINLNLTIDQTVVNAGGTLQLTSNYTLTLAGSGTALTINGFFNWSSGTIASTGSVKISGTLQWSGGSLQTSLVNQGTVNIPGNVNIYSSFNNNSTVNWLSNDIYFQNGSISNSGAFNVYGNGNLYNSNGGTFTNNSSGTFNQTNGNTYAYSNINFNNNGTINLNTGIFSINGGTFTNTKKINFNGGNLENHATANFNSGTTITGGGNLTEVYNNLNVNLALTLPSAITLYVTGGTIAGSGSLTLNGIFNWSAGAVNVGLNIQNTSVVNISYNSVDLYSTLTNSGTINWANSNINFHAATLINNKTFNAFGNGSLYNSNGGTFTNSATGRFIRQVGIGNITNAIIFNNDGTMSLNSGEFYNSGGTFTNTGTINFAGGNLENVTTTNFNSGTSLTGSGAIIASANTINFNTSVTLPTDIRYYINGSSTVTGTGSLQISGNMYWTSGTLNLPLSILSTATLNIGNSNVGLYSAITNNGTINWLNGYIYFYGGSISNNKSFNILSDEQLYKSTSGTFVNHTVGTVTKKSLGTTTINIPFSNSGVIKGTGAFAFGTNLTNAGIFLPGISTTSTGILTTGTDYKNKILSIRMNSASPGTGYDRLLVNGNVTLGSSDTLKVTASDSMPAGSYIILKWTGTRSGSFKVTQLPSGYTVVYQANKVLIHITTNGLTNNRLNNAETVTNSTVSNNQFSVFPDPAINIIKLNYHLINKSASLQIFDVNGRLIKQESISNKSNSDIDVSKFTSGTYVLQLKDGTSIKTAKFIKQ